MSRILPHPLLTLMLLVMWLLLNDFTIGHLVLGGAIALAAANAMARLQPARPRLRKWHLIPKLVAIVVADIWRSNVAVARLILRRDQRRRVAGFVVVPLDLRHRMRLAILACIVTSTPGTAWVEFDPAEGKLLLHVFDLVDEAYWIALIKNRYERLLLDIME